jgi:hypothetical protein
LSQPGTDAELAASIADYKAWLSANELDDNETNHFRFFHWVLGQISERVVNAGNGKVTWKIK